MRLALGDDHSQPPAEATACSQSLPPGLRTMVAFAGRQGLDTEPLGDTARAVTLTEPLTGDRVGSLVGGRVGSRDGARVGGSYGPIGQRRGFHTHTVSVGQWEARRVDKGSQLYGRHARHHGVIIDLPACRRSLTVVPGIRVGPRVGSSVGLAELGDRLGWLVGADVGCDVPEQVVGAETAVVAVVVQVKEADLVGLVLW